MVERCTECNSERALNKINECCVLCTNCDNKLRIDVTQLKSRSCSVQFKELTKWLGKNAKTTNNLFINGCYNKNPETLLLSEDTLNKIHLKAL